MTTTSITSSASRLYVNLSGLPPMLVQVGSAETMLDSNEFVEVFIDTPLSVAEERDVKGLYAKARSGKIKNFTGIDSPYEIPKNPDIHIKTLDLTIDEAAEQILRKIIS